MASCRKINVPIEKRDLIITLFLTILRRDHFNAFLFQGN